MKITKKKRFDKSYQKLSRKIQDKTDETLFLFAQNPFDKRLRNHGLNGDYAGLRSIDVTGDYRIIFKELSDNSYELVELIDVGTHSELY